MGQYRSYSDEFREGALLLLRASGYPGDEGGLARTAKHLNIPASTLDSWWRKHTQTGKPKVRDEKKQELSELYEQEIRAAFEEANVKRGDASYRDIITGIGILSDKLANLNGEPSQIVQQNISFTRQGLSSLPQHLAPGAAAGGDGAATV